MQKLLSMAESDGSAADAIELFVYQLCKHLGSMIAVLGAAASHGVRWGCCKRRVSRVPGGSARSQAYAIPSAIHERINHSPP
jgi:butyrate kinase